MSDERNYGSTDARPQGKDDFSVAGARRPQMRRRKTCPFSGPEAVKIDYKNVRLLQRFISDSGKITPKRATGVSTAKQRLLAQAIKRARFLALLSYINR